MTVGRADSGRVKLTTEGDTLSIFLRHVDIDETRPPFELQEEMTKFCGITDSAHITLLHWILREPDIGKIEDILQRRNIPNKFPELYTEHVHFQGEYDSQTEESESEELIWDSVETFVNNFNLVRYSRNMIASPWQGSKCGRILSHVCNLENMDPFMLLPQNIDHWTRKARQAGAQFDDVVATSFTYRQDSHHKYDLLRSQSFPAIANVTVNGTIYVRVSSAPQNATDEDTVFAGELYVGLYSVYKMHDSCSNL